MVVENCWVFTVASRQVSGCDVVQGGRLLRFAAGKVMSARPPSSVLSMGADRSGIVVKAVRDAGADCLPAVKANQPGPGARAKPGSTIPRHDSSGPTTPTRATAASSDAASVSRRGPARWLPRLPGRTAPAPRRLRHGGQGKRDQSRTRKGPGSKTMAVVRPFGLNLIRRAKESPPQRPGLPRPRTIATHRHEAPPDTGRRGHKCPDRNTRRRISSTRTRYPGGRPRCAGPQPIPRWRP